MVVIGGAGGPLPASRLSGHRSRRHATTTVAVVASKASALKCGAALWATGRGPFLTDICHGCRAESLKSLNCNYAINLSRASRK